MPFTTDKPWDMPLLNWEPQGSFGAPITPPLLGPTGGTLVCIPPLNQDWIPIILGCLDQLRIPATWAAVDDADLGQSLDWMQQLKDIVASAGPCCDVAMRLTAGCVLQFSTDSGATWNDVTGWASNFCTCASACVIPPVPPIINGGSTEQRSCNIAGFLATKIIQEAMVKVVAYVGTTGQRLQFATDVLATIGYAFPITYAASLAFKDWYDSVVGQILSEVEAASTDPTLWSLVTCAIFNAIRTTGYVSAGNFAAVEANLAAMSYTYAWVPPVIAAWWNDMGLQNIQAAQSVGALDDVDCSGCGQWCTEYDMRISDNGFSIALGGGSYVPGAGWESAHFAPDNTQLILIEKIWPGAISVNNMKFGVITPQGVAPSDALIQLRSGSSVVNTWHWDPVASGTLQVLTDTNHGPFTGDRIIAQLESPVGGTATMTIAFVEVLGPGVNPLGTSDCVD
jgi:hypothetical protein